jgi:hypothetical protein
MIAHEILAPCDESNALYIKAGPEWESGYEAGWSPTMWARVPST